MSVSVLALLAMFAAACGGGSGSSEGASGSGSLDDVKKATVQILSEGEIREFEGASSFESSGSGFIVDKSGLIVTNNHVVTGAGSLKVSLDGDDDEIPAKVIGVSECNDLAVIQLGDEDDYPTLSWSTEKVEPPLEIYAAGFPLGDPEYTVTKGIVSKGEADGQTNWASVRSVIEHDAAIQPGNSGGPLVDANGAVVGVNYAGGDPGTGTSQYFAINSDRAKGVIEKLRKGDDESIGVNGEAFVDEETGLAGVWVRGVAPGGIAADAGIKPGDTITTLNGVALESGTMEEYCDVLRSNDLDDAMSVRVLRLDTEEVLEGELNGDELTPVSSFASEVGDDLPAGEGSGGEAQPAGEFVEVTDDTGNIGVRVPSNWSDTLTSPQDIVGNGEPSPAIEAAPDLSAFESDAGPGMAMFLISGVSGVTNDELLDNGSEGSGCNEVNRSDYNDSVFSGRYIELDCGSTLGIILVANPTGDPSTVVLVAAAAVSQQDLRAIDEVLASFNIL